MEFPFNVVIRHKNNKTIIINKPDRIMLTTGNGYISLQHHTILWDVKPIKLQPIRTELCYILLCLDQSEILPDSGYFTYDWVSKINVSCSPSQERRNKFNREGMIAASLLRTTLTTQACEYSCLLLLPWDTGKQV